MRTDDEPDVPARSGLELIAAVRELDTERVRALLPGRAADLDARDEDDWSALDRAAGAGSVALTSLLLEAGADPTATGREGRTPYEIALGASHVEVVRLLRAAEDDASTGAPPERRWRPYCRAYPSSALRAFPGWSEAAGMPDDEDDPVVFVHDDLTVTRGIWVGEDVVFDRVDAAWETFCTDRLGFTVPDDLDLLPTDLPAADETVADETVTTP